MILSGTRLLSTGYVKQKSVIDLIPENPHGAFPPPPPNITESQEMHGFTKVIIKPKPFIGCTIILFRCIAR